MDATKSRTRTSSRTRSIAFIGLTIAILVVSAWVQIPIGPVPLTLQIFALMFAIMALQPRECLIAIVGYIVLGAIGLPVFAGMSGGIGVIAGVTGGFIWGWAFGAGLALLFMHAMGERRNFGVEIIASIIFLGVVYLCGWAQYMAVAGVGPEAAFAVTVAPFVAVDIIKVVAAVVCAKAVKKALHA